jgi:hypothetical protein
MSLTLPTGMPEVDAVRKSFAKSSDSTPEHNLDYFAE